ncbi:MAG TPA: aminopeptidase, partial [Eubacteriaceae bacterium]|nr:aminopeptidase [Eubacteriaceae bacterium]
METDKLKLKKQGRNVWDVLLKEKNDAFLFCDGYKLFLDKGKTEREAAQNIAALAEKEGYKCIDYYLENNMEIKTGDKVYSVYKGKQVVLFKMGSVNPEKGFLMIGSHIDAPRLDLKQSPLYEDGKLSFFKTHYYGGIKKYQWITTPLAMHGTIVKEDGSAVKVCIGEDEKDPVFFITDLLPHLSKDMMGKKIGEAVEGEMLNLLIGS